jgi:subtilisin family serine protease
MKNSNRGVKEQIERILDETSSKTVSVILQLENPSGFEQSLKAAAKQEIARRSVTGASALLPPKAGKSKDAVHRQLVRSSTNASLPQAGKMRAQAQLTLARAAKNSVFSESRLARRAGEKAKPTELWLSKALVAEVDRDDLIQYGEVLEATAVFENRKVELPPRWKSTDVPPEVDRLPTHTWGLERSGALACWGAFGARGGGARIAVLDTGVIASHTDLKSAVKEYAEFDEKGGLSAQGVAKARDDHGHGTHVCGTIAGGNASGRWIGMAPEAELLVGRVLGRTGGTDAQILAGMAWAVASGADVINMSLGGLRFDPDVMDTYTSAIRNAREYGVSVVAAMGNDGAQTTSSPANDWFSFAVGATDVNDRVAGFSAGRTQIIKHSSFIDAKHLPFVYSKPDLVAPGVDVLSASRDKKWEYLSGTSMATPHVAGALALLLTRTKVASVLRTLSGPDRVTVLQDLLIGSVEQLGESGQDHRYGWGRLNVLAAYSKAIELGYLPAP